MGNDSIRGSMTPESIPWQWCEETHERNRDVVLEAAGGARFTLERSSAGAVTAIKRNNAEGQGAWSTAVSTPFANTASLVVEGKHLYAALYSDIATGCEVIALDAETGKLRWRMRLQGLGPLHHSKYQNRVQIRILNTWLVIFGDEAAGKYIEVLDPERGGTISNRVVKP
jgi:outer membrane protein assembly factor BamB